MPIVDEMFPKDYLRASDLEKPVKVTVSRITQEPVFDFSKRKKIPKWVIYFKGKKKYVILGPSLSDEIARVLGSRDTDDWTGQRFVLGTEPITVKGLQLRTFVAKPAPEKKAKPPMPKESNGDELENALKHYEQHVEEAVRIGVSDSHIPDLPGDATTVDHVKTAYKAVSRLINDAKKTNTAVEKFLELSGQLLAGGANTEDMPQLPDNHTLEHVQEKIVEAKKLFAKLPDRIGEGEDADQVGEDAELEAILEEGSPA